MGNVLAMNIRTAFAFAGLLALIGCGSENNQRGEVGALTKAAIKNAVAKRSGSPAAPQLTRAAIDASPVPLVHARILSRGAEATLAPVAVNGGDETWMSGDPITLTLRGGLLIATRGLGEDMMSASAPDAATVTRGTGQTSRSFFHLDGENHTVRQNFACFLSGNGQQQVVVFERTYETRYITETCSGNNAGFTNEYWVDSAGNILKSRQWVSPSVGKLELQRVKG